jgi:alpha 1,2-mannosyltransferase
MRAQTQWRTFLRESPAYPVKGFSGRGIVILAGGLTYMVPAWVNIHMLRKTGFLATAHHACNLGV